MITQESADGKSHMLKMIEKILEPFRSCFSREKAYGWFVTIIVGLMIRTDDLGVTSIIRDLGLSGANYPSMLHFFRADSWELKSLITRWTKTIAEIAPLREIGGYTVLIGDGVKRASDGRYMPCMKKMVQESENSTKPTFVHGHLFGAVGVLIGSAKKSFCLPLSIRLHDGIQAVEGWSSQESVSHVVRMFRDGSRAARHFGKSLFVLDRYFLTVPLLLEWKALVEKSERMLEIVTRAKSNCTAYEAPGPYKGRGRRPVHGAAVHLKDLFQSASASFRTAKLCLYGEEKKVRFLSRTLLWGQKLYQPLQFVLAEYDGKQIILVSTSLTLAAEDIITAYACRFRIEAMFREMKQQIGGFCYHFWTRATPKLDHFRKKGVSDPLWDVTQPTERVRIIRTIQATEAYVMLCSIAFGIIQLLCLHFQNQLHVPDFRFLRTYSHSGISEASLMTYLRVNLFRFMASCPHSSISKFISCWQIPPNHADLSLLAG